MPQPMPDSKARWLHRGRLRDLVVALCLVSALVCPRDTAMLAVALVLFTAGCLLHVLVKGQLIRNVTLCTEGAYSIVRHPYYLANYLVDVSLCLLSGNVYLVLLYPFLFYWAYGPTFAEEEALLASMHPRGLRNLPRQRSPGLSHVEPVRRVEIAGTRILLAAHFRQGSETPLPVRFPGSVLDPRPGTGTLGSAGTGRRAQSPGNADDHPAWRFPGVPARQPGNSPPQGRVARLSEPWMVRSHAQPFAGRSRAGQTDYFGVDRQ